MVIQGYQLICGYRHFPSVGGLCIILDEHFDRLYTFAVHRVLLGQAKEKTGTVQYLWAGVNGFPEYIFANKPLPAVTGDCSSCTPLAYTGIHNHNTVVIS